MPTYKLNYCNAVFLTVAAESMREVTQKAMESAAYTQCDIKIRDENYNAIAISKWHGIPPEDWDKPLLQIGGGFYDGFQDTKYFEYI